MEQGADGSLPEAELDVEIDSWKPSADLLDSILEDPRKNFAEFLYESNVLETFELLNALIVHEPRDGEGHTAAIECLWCWQDLMESANPDLVEKCPFGLSPIVDELRQATRLEIACSALRLIVALCKMAPNPVSRIRLRHELNELRMDELVNRLKEQFDRDPELCELIGEWMRTRNDNNTDRHSVGRASTETDSPTTANEIKRRFCRCGSGAIRADADSGTFSGMDDDYEEEEIILRDDDDEDDAETNSSASTSAASHTDTRQKKSPEIAKLVRCIRSQPFDIHANTVTNMLVELLHDLIPALKAVQIKATTTTFPKEDGKLPTTIEGKSEESRLAEEKFLLQVMSQFRHFINRTNIMDEKNIAAIQSPLSLTSPQLPVSKFTKEAAVIVAPPPPPPAPPPPPPPLAMSRGIRPPDGPLPPPPPNLNGLKPGFKSGIKSASLKIGDVEIPKALKPKRVPPEGKKFRHLQWTKVPPRLAAGQPPRPVPITAEDSLPSSSNDLTSCSSVWQRLDRIDSSLCDKLDFSELDVYFACVEYPSVSTATTANGKTVAPNMLSPLPKPVQVRLISEKRSLSVNIFLKMCKNVDALVDSLAQSDAEAIGVERLRMLVPLLPSEEEQKTLRHYTGDANALGPAEKFLLQLMRIPDFKLRVEAMTLRLEFDTIMTDIEPGLRILVSACKELISSECLQRVLYVLLHAGNYLNHGAAVGNAVGFRLNSLWKINELRAVGGSGAGTKMPRTLLHFIAQLNNCADDFEIELKHVTDAAKLSFEALRTDLSALSQRIQRFETQLRDKSDDEFFAEFKKFISHSKTRLLSLTCRLTEIEALRIKLAIYFCEEEKTFSMEECFKIFCAFLNSFRSACTDNGASLKPKMSALFGQNNALFTSMSNSTHNEQKISVLPTLATTVSSIDHSMPTEVEPCLSSFFLNGNDLPPTPRARSARHSIHVPSRSDDSGITSSLIAIDKLGSVPSSPKMRRASLMLPECDSRDRQREMSQMLSANNSNLDGSVGNVIRRRTSISVGQNEGVDENDEAATAIHSRERSSTHKSQRLATINDDETVSTTGAGKNNLEAFVDKAIEITTKRAQLSSSNSGYTGRRYSTAIDLDTANLEESRTTNDVKPIDEQYVASINGATIASTTPEEPTKRRKTSISRSTKSNENQTDIDLEKNILTISIGASSPTAPNQPMTSANASSKKCVTSQEHQKIDKCWSTEQNNKCSTSSGISSNNSITTRVEDKKKGKTLNRINSARTSILESANSVRSISSTPQQSSLIKSKCPGENKPNLKSTLKKDSSFNDAPPSSLTKTSAARRANFYRVRARQSMAEEEVVPHADSATPMKILRPSEIRASQKQHKDADLSSTTSTARLFTARSIAMSNSSSLVNTSRPHKTSTQLCSAQPSHVFSKAKAPKLSSENLLNGTRTSKISSSSETSRSENSATRITSNLSMSNSYKLREAISKSRDLTLSSLRTTRTNLPTKSYTTEKSEKDKSEYATTRKNPVNTLVPSIRSRTSGVIETTKPTIRFSNAQPNIKNSSTHSSLSNTSMNTKTVTSINQRSSNNTILATCEKRQVIMKPTNSVSTASRPALIKTGSMPSESGKPCASNALKCTPHTLIKRTSRIYEQRLIDKKTTTAQLTSSNVNVDTTETTNNDDKKSASKSTTSLRSNLNTKQ